MEESHGSQPPHSTVELAAGGDMDWDGQIMTPASVSTQYSEVSSPSGDPEQVPSFASEVEVCSQEDGGNMLFSMKFNSASGKVEPEGANNRQLWNSLSEEARKGIINMFQHKAATRNEEAVNDLKKYKVDIDAVISKDVQKIPVKTLRKIIPEMRIVSYLEESQYIGKKKIKHLWDKDSQPKDWPRDVPFLDPNNGDRNGPKTQVPVRGKPGKDVLMKMFEFLKKKYLTLSVKQPVEEQGSLQYTPNTAPFTAATLPIATSLPMAVEPQPTTSQEWSTPMQMNAQPSQARTQDTTSEVVNSMYERLGSKFNQVAQLPTSHQEAQTLLHNLICALQEMYQCDKKRFLQLGHEMERILDLVLFTRKQDDWADFMQECRNILDRLEPVKTEPGVQHQVLHVQQNYPVFTAAEVKTETDVFKDGLKGDPDFFKPADFTKPVDSLLDLLGETFEDVTTVKKEMEQRSECQWNNTQPKGMVGGGGDDDMGVMGVNWRTTRAVSSLDLQSFIEGRDTELLSVDTHEGKRDDESKVQDKALADQNFKDSTAGQTVTMSVLAEALKASDPMWTQGQPLKKEEEDDILEGVLGLQDDYILQEIKSPEPLVSPTLNTENGSVIGLPTQAQPAEQNMVTPTLQSNPVLGPSGMTAVLSPEEQLLNQLLQQQLQQQQEQMVLGPPVVPQQQMMSAPPAEPVGVRAAHLFRKRGVPEDLARELIDNLTDESLLMDVADGRETVRMERPTGEVITIDMGADHPVKVTRPATQVMEEMETDNLDVGGGQPMAAAPINSWLQALQRTQPQEMLVQQPEAATPGYMPLPSPGIPSVVEDLEMEDDDFDFDL